jgi:hypothetical protein
VQRSLFAFECGKALYLKLDLGSWFSLNFSAYAAALNEMLVAGKAPGERNGGLFRVEMLQISATNHPDWRAPLAKLEAMLRRITSANSP